MTTNIADDAETTAPERRSMTVGRIIGWICIAIAVVALAADIVMAISDGEWTSTALGQHWFNLHNASLGLFQVVVQRYLWPSAGIGPFLWDPVITTILIWPTWAVFGVPGIALARVFRRRKRKRWFS